ncbi:hypothetical protein KNE206_56330 [Kitasatospora sp. NE20-6]|uniref:hypothetical protein n=1 Tax=Kitasatospora sp. NE20-6 TaxID=2859066 RepID=UPI0034DC2FBF
MMPTQPSVRIPSHLKGDADPDTLDALVHSSRRLGRFWPLLAAGPQPASSVPVGVSVPPGVQRLVASMAEYGG